MVIAGHTRLKAIERLRSEVGSWGPERRAALARRIGAPGDDPALLRAALALVPVRFLDVTRDEARAIALADNRLGEFAEWDEEALTAILRDLSALDFSSDLLGWDEEEFKALLEASSAAPPPPAPRPSLSDRFVVPPFSVLDARQGYWQDRKRQWLSIGIESELGRGASPGGSPRPSASLGSDGTDRGNGNGGRLTFVKGAREDLDETSRLILERGSGTSIFDPVVCELAYRWWCPPGGSVLDPFAGGSVRGIVAGLLGHAYTGIELRPDQVAANEVQAERLFSASSPTDGSASVDDPAALTPVERRGSVWVKRDDLLLVGSANGGKVRGILAMLPTDAKGIVACGSRQSTQIARAAQVAAHLGLPCRVHTGEGSETVEMAEAAAAGAEVVKHSPARLTVIKARARVDAAERGWFEVPWGLESEEGVSVTASQVANLPPAAKRVVVVVGGGMSLSGILHGMDSAGIRVPVLGVTVGSDPSDRLDKWAPKDWRDRVTLVPSGLDYEEEVEADVGGIVLDPVYEAKAARFLDPDDCLWIVGCRSSVRKARVPVGAVRWVRGNSERVEDLLPGEQFDLVFSCPPYGDLEVYSDDPEDLSTMTHEAFLESYRRIIAASVAKLRPDRFAVFVVGDFRDGRGFYRNFVADTISAFQDAGATLYNEAVLATAISSLPLRAGRQFAAGRKLGKTHQNVLVFYNGDPAQIRATYGDVDVTMPEIEETPE